MRYMNYLYGAYSRKSLMRWVAKRCHFFTHPVRPSWHDRVSLAAGRGVKRKRLIVSAACSHRYATASRNDGYLRCEALPLHQGTCDLRPIAAATWKQLTQPPSNDAW